MLRLPWLPVIVLLSACASQPAPPAQGEPAQSDRRIVPGERIGPVSIGMTARQLAEGLGPPTGTVRLPGGTENYFANGLRVVVDNASRKVRRITTLNTLFATAEGARKGLSGLEIKRRLGEPGSAKNHGTRDAARWMYCYPQGLALQMDRDTVTSLSVFVPSEPCF